MKKISAMIFDNMKGFGKSSTLTNYKSPKNNNENGNNFDHSSMNVIRKMTADPQLQLFDSMPPIEDNGIEEVENSGEDSPIRPIIVKNKRKGMYRNFAPFTEFSNQDHAFEEVYGRFDPKKKEEMVRLMKSHLENNRKEVDFLNDFLTKKAHNESKLGF